MIEPTDKDQNPIQLTGEKLDEFLDQQANKDITHLSRPALEAEEEKFFAEAIQMMNLSGIPYAVGAAFARYIYTGIWRPTKDLDIFIKPADVSRTLAAFNAAGYSTEIKSGHWLAKAHHRISLIDVIFGSGHGQVVIDDRWFENNPIGEVLGVQAPIVRIEEMIALSSFVATRHRFDAAEVLHLILSVQGKVDWDRVLELLGDNRLLLLWHLILFDFVYPGHSEYLPKELMVQLFEDMRFRWGEPPENPKAFRGTLLDPYSFTVDVEDWGYEERRKTSPLVSPEGESL